MGFTRASVFFEQDLSLGNESWSKQFLLCNELFTFCDGTSNDDYMWLDVVIIMCSNLQLPAGKRSQSLLILVDQNLKLGIKLWTRLACWFTHQARRATQIWCDHDNVPNVQLLLRLPSYKTYTRDQAVNQACMLVYTSGTTGNPKGTMISQDNLTWTVEVTMINKTLNCGN